MIFRVRLRLNTWFIFEGWKAATFRIQVMGTKVNVLLHILQAGRRNSSQSNAWKGAWIEPGGLEQPGLLPAAALGRGFPVLKAEGLIPAARSSVWNGHFTLRASAGHIQGAGRGRTGGTGTPGGGWVGWVCTCRRSLWWPGGGGDELPITWTFYVCLLKFRMQRMSWVLRVRRSPTARMPGCRAQVCNQEHGSDIRELQLSAVGADDEHFSASAMQIRACGGCDWAPLGV